MKLLIACVIISIICSSCTIEKKTMDSWIGSTKQNLILKWGPPARIASDGGNGEILIYSTQSYLYGSVYYRYRMFYADSNGNIYHWLIQGGQVPPQQMDVNLYVR